MAQDIKRPGRPIQTKFSFGAASAIITNLSLIAGLDTLTHPRLTIIGGILVIALADNISDSLGIHIYQESEHLSQQEVWLSTCTNFLARVFVSLSFIFWIAVLPIGTAVACSLIWGLILLVAMSYNIAKDKAINPYSAICEHVIIAVLVISASHFIGRFVIGKFK